MQLAVPMHEFQPSTCIGHVPACGRRIEPEASTPLIERSVWAQLYSDEDVIGIPVARIDHLNDVGVRWQCRHKLGLSQQFISIGNLMQWQQFDCMFTLKVNVTHQEDARREGSGAEVGEHLIST